MEEIAKKDEAQMQNIINTSIYITQALDDYNSRVQSSTALAKEAGVPDLIGESTPWVSCVFFIFY